MLRSQKERVRQETIQILSQKPVFLDTETTGLGHSDEVIDIAVIGFNGEILLNSLVKPKKTIPAEATRIHGITNKMVASAPSISEIWNRLESALSGTLLGIYNKDYDLRIIRQSSILNGVTRNLSVIRSFCIMELFAEYYGQWDEYHQSFTWQKLSKAGRFLGISIPNSHRALDDALLARQVLIKMAENN